jgi:hypothetical protein
MRVGYFCINSVTCFFNDSAVKGFTKSDSACAEVVKDASAANMTAFAALLARLLRSLFISISLRSKCVTRAYASSALCSRNDKSF